MAASKATETDKAKVMNKVNISTRPGIQNDEVMSIYKDWANEYEQVMLYRFSLSLSPVYVCVCVRARGGGVEHKISKMTYTRHCDI